VGGRGTDILIYFIENADCLFSVAGNPDGDGKLYRSDRLLDQKRIGLVVFYDQNVVLLAGRRLFRRGA